MKITARISMLFLFALSAGAAHAAVPAVPSNARTENWACGGSREDVSANFTLTYDETGKKIKSASGSYIGIDLSLSRKKGDALTLEGFSGTHDDNHTVSLDVYAAENGVRWAHLRDVEFVERNSSPEPINRDISCRLVP
jgi:hypothetical protein